MKSLLVCLTPNRLEHLERPFAHGRAIWRRDVRLWSLLLLLAIAGVAAAALLTFLLLPSSYGRPLSEIPFPFDAWGIDWGPTFQAASAEQALQIRVFSIVIGVAAALAAFTAFVTSVILWRQRIELRKDEYSLLRAIGARQAQLLSRLAGEGQFFGTAMIVGSLVAVALIPQLVAMTFPGVVNSRWMEPVALVPLLVIVAIVARLEMMGGEPRQRLGGKRFGDVFSSLTLIFLLGFVTLSGALLLARHSPNPGSGEGLITARPAFIVDSGDEVRGGLLQGWQARSTERGAPIGFASAGTVRGTGPQSLLIVDCGMCFIGSMYVPVQSLQAEFFAVAPDTFVRLGRRMEEGRDFDWRVDQGRLGVAIVNESLARRYFEDQNAIGRKIRFGDTDWLTVIGVVSDRPHSSHLSEYEVFLSLSQAASANIEVISSWPSDNAEVVADTSPALTVLGKPIDLGGIFATHLWFRGVLELVAWFTIALVALGTWAATKSEIASLSREAGVRMAFGARDRDLWAFVLRVIGKRVAIGIIGGAWFSLFLGIGLHLAPGTIPQFDVVVWGEVAAIMIVVVLIAAVPAFAPVIRMTPLEALHEPF